MFTQNDLQTLQAKGITEADACKQLHRFKSGFPYLRLLGSPTVGHGIAMGNGFAVLHGESLDGMACGVPEI